MGVPVRSARVERVSPRIDHDLLLLAVTVDRQNASGSGLGCTLGTLPGTRALVSTVRITILIAVGALRTVPRPLHRPHPHRTSRVEAIAEAGSTPTPLSPSPSPTPDVARQAHLFSVTELGRATRDVLDEPEPHVFVGSLEHLRSPATGMDPEFDPALLDVLEGLAVDDEQELAEGCLATRVA